MAAVGKNAHGACDGRKLPLDRLVGSFHMLVVGDLSGIQEFLFDVRASGGNQAACLRFRSFRIQVIAECLARKFLWACGLGEKRLLFVAAGKFVIDADGTAASPKVISQVNVEAQNWLLENTHGRLRLAVAAEGSDSSNVDRYHLAMAALQRSKLRAWSVAVTGTWTAVALSTGTPWDAERDSERDKEQGRLFLGANVLTLAPVADQSHDPRAIAGIVPTLRHHVDSPSNDLVEIDLEQFSRHIPREADGSPTEFIALAGKSRGNPMLGVFKADADSLGVAIRRRLAGAADLSPLESFSKKLGQFFGVHLDKMMSAPGSRWSKLYMVFSGGDDLLLVGPWDLVLDFAAHVQREFSGAFSDEQLTLSAGMALIKPKFPIRLAAMKAEDLLEQAKSQPAFGAMAARDQFAGLGGCWKWSDHVRIIDAGKRLAYWTELGKARGGIERAWLHTLLELALLQRRLADPRSPHVIPAMATSRLAYHVSRNWPKKGPARQWIDAILKDFDRISSTRDPIMLHLTSIIRYAMLATGSTNGEE